MTGQELLQLLDSLPTTGEIPQGHMSVLYLEWINSSIVYIRAGGLPMKGSYIKWTKMWDIAAIARQGLLPPEACTALAPYTTKSSMFYTDQDLT